VGKFGAKVRPRAKTTATTKSGAEFNEEDDEEDNDCEKEDQEAQDLDEVERPGRGALLRFRQKQLRGGGRKREGQETYTMSRVGSPWAALAVVVAGVVSGVYIFKPPLEKLNEDVRRKAEAARQNAAAGSAEPAADP